MKSPTIERVAGLYRATWPDDKVVIELDRITEHSDETRGQLTVLVNDLIVAQFGYNLSSLAARDKAAKYLKERHEADWGLLLEMACYQVLKRLREGEPRVDLSMTDTVTPVSWLLQPLLPKAMPTMVFADGGSGKSYLALLVSMLVGFPWTDNPFKWKVPVEPVTTLLLDWETERDVVTYRLNRICRGMNQPRPPLEYRRCTRPLIMDLSAIQKHVMESKAGLLVVDSLGMACGGDLKEQAAATTFFQAIRELQVTSLLLTHMAKDEMRKTKTAFGSIYFQNHSRSVWEMSKTQDAGSNLLHIGLFQRKQNETAMHKPLALEMEFDNIKDITVFRAASLDDMPDLREKLSLKEQIKGALRRGALSVNDLANELGKPQETIRVTCYKYKDTFIKVGNDWGLKEKV